MQDYRLEIREKERKSFKNTLQHRICDIMRDKLIWLPDNGMAFKSDLDKNKITHEKDIYVKFINPSIKEGIPNYPMLYLVVNCDPMVLVLEKSNTDFLKFLKKSKCQMDE